MKIILYKYDKGTQSIHMQNCHKIEEKLTDVDDEHRIINTSLRDSISEQLKRPIQACHNTKRKLTDVDDEQRIIEK